MEATADLESLLWGAGWLAAVGVLAGLGMSLPVALPGARWRRRLLGGVIAIGGVAVAVFALTALTLHDTHLDLTREHAYTPAPAALRVAATLKTPLTITYFYQGQDPNARRARDMLKLLAAQNPLLSVRAIDPDKQPSLAETAGVKIYNAALIESAGRKVLVQGTDEAEFAIGIQRVLRERRVTLCFVEGHNEYAIDNEEFHTHLEGAVGHSHDDASSLVIETAGHGIGRWRRSLESLGYDTKRVALATATSVPGDCAVLIDAGPRTTWLPAESAALRQYLRDGGSVLLLHDLGYSLEPGLQQLLTELGATPLQAVVTDPVNHYGTDTEMVAVTGYDPHPITNKVAYTFFPGVRPLQLFTPRAGVTMTPLIRSGAAATLRAVTAIEQRTVAAAPGESLSQTPQAQVLAATSEGRLDAADGAPFRLVLVGDADFLSNSFYPYMANSDLALGLVRWLAREEALIAVPQRVPVPALVLLTEDQLRMLYLVVVGLLPLSSILVGVLVWWRRR